MDASVVKVCNRCSKRKPLTEFGNCHLAKDGKAGHCNGCKHPRKKWGSAVKIEPDRAIEVGAGPTLKYEAAIGFSAQRRGVDLVIEQESGEGVATIWLSRHEAADLAEWINSQMEAWLKAPPDPTTEGNGS